MRYLTGVTASLALILAAGAAEAGGHGSQPEWSGGTGSAYIGGVMLHRSNPEGVNDFSYGWRAGLEAEFRAGVWPGHEVQLRYFGVDQWSNTATTQFGLTTGNSNLHSLELNLVHHWNPRTRLFFGARWVQANEDAEDGPGNTIFLRNSMYGAQLGAEYLLWDDGGPLTLTTGLAAGLLYNRASRDASFGALPQDSRSSTAFLGELGITARYRLTDQLSLRAGYRLLWLNGVAAFSAAEVASINDGDPVGTSAGRFHHGATLGIEFRF